MSLAKIRGQGMYSFTWGQQRQINLRPTRRLSTLCRDNVHIYCHVYCSSIFYLNGVKFGASSKYKSPCRQCKTCAHIPGCKSRNSARPWWRITILTAASTPIYIANIGVRRLYQYNYHTLGTRSLYTVWNIFSSQSSWRNNASFLL